MVPSIPGLCSSMQKIALSLQLFYEWKKKSRGQMHCTLVMATVDDFNDKKVGVPIPTRICVRSPTLSARLLQAKA